MQDFTLSADDEALIDALVKVYEGKRDFISSLLDSLNVFLSDAMNRAPLSELVHSSKRRLKDPAHLKTKLIRKLVECQQKSQKFDYTPENLLLKITDLAGYRILHLNTRQMKSINDELLKVFDDASWEPHEDPFVYVWDNESVQYFKSINIRPELHDKLYVSVHYILRSRSKVAVTCEVQVRTLADEIWGEIDHKINYPEPHSSLACREQIKALARITSSCSRLVDSIMSTHDDYWLSQPKDTKA
jgi:GTP pyrophosphokinase